MYKSIPQQQPNTFASQEKLKPVSAHALYMALPAIPPTETEVIVRKHSAQGISTDKELWTVSPENYAKMPVFDWYQVFNMVGVTLPPPPTKAEKDAAKRARKSAEKAAQWAAWSASASSSK